MTDTWARHLEEFQELATPLLQDADGLAALLVAAAGAMGCAALAPPLVRRGPDGRGALLLANESLDPETRLAVMNCLRTLGQPVQLTLVRKQIQHTDPAVLKDRERDR